MSSKSGRERPAWSLAARLTVWYAGSSFVLLLAASGFLYWALVANLDREDDQFLADKVHLLRKLLRERPQDTEAVRREAEEEWAARQLGQVHVRLLDEAGRVLLETPGMDATLAPAVFPPAGPADAEPGHGVEIETASGKSYRVVAVRAAVGPGGETARVVQLAFDRTYEEALLVGYRRNLAAVLGAALVLCTVAGYYLARRGLRSLAAVTATARRIRAATLSERIALRGQPAELAELAATFNDMLDRLEEAFARLARFSADIAHELRTPVNNLRGEAEVALHKPRAPEEYRDVLGSCLEECGRLARLIDSLLFLARAEGPDTPLTAERVDVGQELETVRAYYEAAAVEAGVVLTVAAAPAAADVDRTLFQRAVGNLVANALAHTPPGGRVTLSASAENGQVRVAVTDTGRGIAAEHLPHLFDRFYRADPSRSSATGGVGLGLAIVKSIAELHRGTAAVTSELGKGTRITLTLPSRRAGFPA